MSIYADIRAFGGATKPTEKTQCIVSFWRIPGGSDYDRAYVVKCYFEKNEDGERFAKKYESQPHMASIAYSRARTIRTVTR